MSLQQFLAILLARRWLFAAVVAAVLVPAVALSLFLPKRYLATASLVVDVKPDPISGMPVSLMSSTAIATQIDIITSERVARRVVRMLKLGENPAVRERWNEATAGQTDIETWLVDQFEKQLDVRPSRESSVISINFTAADPKFAAGMANAFAQAYLDTVLDLRVDPAKQYSSFFDARAKEARDALEKAQSRLSAFQRESGVVMTDEKMDVENQRLNDLSQQLVAMQSATADASSRQSQATAGAADKMMEVTGNPVVAGLRTDLSRAEAKLQELNSRLGESHPQVVELKANIGELRQRLDTEVKRLSAGVGVASTITRQREGTVRYELEAQRAKVLKMKQVRDDGLLILRDVENAQRAYDQIQQRLTQSSLESRATSTNVSPLTVATPPARHAYPKLWLNTLLALSVGLLLGAGAVLAVELRDRRVRGAVDVTELLNLPLLGAMPGPDGRAALKQLARTQRRSLTFDQGPQ